MRDFSDPLPLCDLMYEWTLIKFFQVPVCGFLFSDSGLFSHFPCIFSHLFARVNPVRPLQSSQSRDRHFQQRIRRTSLNGWPVWINDYYLHSGKGTVINADHLIFYSCSPESTGTYYLSKGRQFMSPTCHFSESSSFIELYEQLACRIYSVFISIHTKCENK